MAKSISGQIIDGVVSLGVAGWFRQAGFRCKGRSFWRQHGELVLTSNVQASKVNMPGGAKFALNMGVEWPQWYQVWTGQPLRANPTLAPAFISARLHPTGGHRDFWWPANQDTEQARVADEVVVALDAQAEDFWSRYGDLDAVLAELDGGAKVPTGTPRGLVHAALLVRAGRSVDAQHVIAEAASRTPGLAVLMRVSERLGLGGLTA